MRFRRFLAVCAALTLLGALVVIAPVSVAAGSAGTARSVSKVGTGTIATGSFSPSNSGSLALEDEFPGGEADADAGPAAYNGVIDRSLSTGHVAKGVSVNSGSKAKSNPTFVTGFEGLNHYQQRYSRGGKQFSLEPPDQGLCVGNGYVLEAT